MVKQTPGVVLQSKCVKCNVAFAHSHQVNMWMTFKWTIKLILMSKARKISTEEAGSCYILSTLTVICYFKDIRNHCWVSGLMASICKSPSSSTFYLLPEIRENIDSLLRSVRHSQSPLSFWLQTISLLWWPHHPQSPSGHWCASVCVCVFT